MKIKLACVKKPEQKLLFVKTIKMATDLGLKEVKDIADFLFSNLNIPVEIDLVDNPDKTDGLSSIDYLTKNLPNCGGKTKILGGKDWQRDFKMLSIGIGDEQDYVIFLLEYLDMYRKKEVLKEVLENLHKEQLVSIINKIEI